MKIKIFLAFGFLLCSFQNQPISTYNNFKLSVRILNSTNDDVFKIVRQRGFQSLVLNKLYATEKLDNLGEQSVTFEVKRHEIVNFNFREFFLPIYVVPDGDLAISFDANNPETTVRFSGGKEKENSFFKLKYEKLVGFSNTGYVPEGNNSISFNDSLFTYMRDLSEKFYENNPEDKVFASIDSLDNYAYWLDNKLVEGLYQKNIRDPEDKFYDFVKDIPINHQFALSLPNFLWALDRSLILKEYTLWDEFPSMTTNEFYIKKYQYIQNNFEGELRDIFSGIPLKEYLLVYGLDENIESVANNYTDSSLSGEMKTQISEITSKLREYSFDEPAPGFHAINLAGDTILFNEFKGKIVYMDVWATWCKPCIESFPAMKLLREKYKNNKNVLFLYVSKDERISAWKKKINQDLGSNVKHLVVPGHLGEEFNNKFIIGFVPTYMLFDKDGKTIQFRAPSPSSPEIIKLIDRNL